MQEKRKPIKRNGKKPSKKLNIKKSRVYDKDKKTSINQVLNDFKASGMTLLKSNNKKRFGRVKVIVAIAVIIIVSVAVLVTSNAPTGIVEYISSKVAMSKSGESFPVSYDFSNGGNITYSNGSIIVTTENEIKCINKTGNLIYSRSHGFATPIIKTSKIRTLIYGVDDSRYKIETAEKEVFSKKTQDNSTIVTADISNCGVYALVTESDEDISLVTVYDKFGKEIYKYHSANNYVIGVTVSENGKRICVISLSTKQAEFVSKISVFSLNKTEPIFEEELVGEVVLAAEYTNSKNVCVITDKQYFNLKNNKITKNLTYNPEFLNKFEISDDYILLYNTADSNSVSGTVHILSKSGRERAQFTVEGNVSDISACNGSVYTLGEKVTEYNFKGDKIKSTDINNGAIKICAAPKGVMVLYSSGVDFIKEG
ncbi:MAG: hypothetical protein IIU65_01825 [Clostridia bacterium]|nr:hypothetical protein [Clostridia bacterium]